MVEVPEVHEPCYFFKDRSRFVELSHAEWVEDEDMYGDPIYRCSNCNEHFVLEEGTPTDNCYSYCPNCGAKMDEQALKERENDTPEAAVIRLNGFRTDKDERDPAIDMAIRAINRVFVKRKPIDNVEGEIECPTCGMSIDEFDSENYCFNCGQALDWS